MTAMTALTAPAATPVRDLGIARLRIQPGRPAALAVGGSPARVPSLPLVECLTVETGRAFVDHRLTRTAQGAALSPVGLEEKEGPWPHHLLTQRDETTGLVALTDLWRPTPASLRVRTRVRNDGAAPLHLTALSILSATALPGAPLDDLDLMTAPSAWMAEQRWRHQRLGKELVDVGTAVHGQSSRDALRLSAESGWSSSRWEPVGILTDPAGGQALAWQVEHNGAWTVEVSRRGDVLGLVVCGPTDLQHGWMRVLHPGQEAATPTAALVLSDGGWQGAAVELTAYRRALRARTAPTTDPAPVVFNDYMNTLMADPTAQRLATLVPAAARAGAEVYCIDDGWHSDEEDGAWWDAVGAWEPSARRFPEGLGATLDLIRDEGMSPGLWIEPLAVGARSPLAAACLRAPSCAATAGPSSSRAACAWTCATPPRASTSTPSWTGWSATASAISRWTTTTPRAPGPTPVPTRPATPSWSTPGRGPSGSPPWSDATRAWSWRTAPRAA